MLFFDVLSMIDLRKQNQMENEVTNTKGNKTLLNESCDNLSEHEIQVINNNPTRMNIPLDPHLGEENESLDDIN